MSDWLDSPFPLLHSATMAELLFGCGSAIAFVVLVYYLVQVLLDLRAAWRTPDREFALMLAFGNGILTVVVGIALAVGIVAIHDPSEVHVRPPFGFFLSLLGVATSWLLAAVGYLLVRARSIADRDR